MTSPLSKKAKIVHAATAEPAQKMPALSEDIEADDANKLLASLKISSFEGLVDKRIFCPGCNKSQKNYCCKCLKVLPGCTAPCLKLPIHLDIVHHVSPLYTPFSALKCGGPSV